MARYKEYSYSQGKFIPIHFSKQILLQRKWQYAAQIIRRESFGRDARLWQAKFKNITTTEAGMEFPEVGLKINVQENGNTFKRTYSTDSL